MPGTSRSSRNVAPTCGQPCSAADVGVSAPSATLTTAAVVAKTIGPSNATAYQRAPARHCTMLLSNATTPRRPRVAASTTTAARNGPKPMIGDGDQPKGYSNAGHQDNPNASAKNATSGCRRTTAVNGDGD